MKLRNFLSIVNPNVKVNLYVEGKEVGLYANAESVREESMYQNYELGEISASMVSNNVAIIVNILR